MRKPRGSNDAAVSSKTDARGLEPNAMLDGEKDSAPARHFSHRPHPKWMYLYPDQRNEIIEELKEAVRTLTARIEELQKERRRRVHRKAT